MGAVAKSLRSRASVSSSSEAPAAAAGYSIWFYYWSRLANVEQGVELGFSSKYNDDDNNKNNNKKLVVRWIDVERFWHTMVAVSLVMTTAKTVEPPGDTAISSPSL